MIGDLKLTVLADNCVHEAGLLAEHGLAFLIEAGGFRILFDTGQGHVLLHNARRLGCSLENLDAVVLSHGHYDHTGGLADVLQLPGAPTIYLHPSAIEDKFARSAAEKDTQLVEQSAKEPSRKIGIPEAALKALEAASNRIIWTRTTTELIPGIAVTGEVPRSHPLEDVGGPFFRDVACRTPDPLADDQALWIETTSGLLVVLGCAHSGVINTLNHISRITGRREVYGLTGGTHLKRASRKRLEATGSILGRLNTQVIAPCHCTGLDAQVYFRARFASRVHECGAGEQLEFSSS
jgi:7,8-dihydropterin-6-yl-methyl-4-(beta-D-ribofuranosyl)aminobenzene 5'-phosphate synthase